MRLFSLHSGKKKEMPMDHGAHDGSGVGVGGRDWLGPRATLGRVEPGASRWQPAASQTRPGSSQPEASPRTSSVADPTGVNTGGNEVHAGKSPLARSRSQAIWIGGCVWESGS